MEPNERIKISFDYLPSDLSNKFPDIHFLKLPHQQYSIRLSISVYF